MYEELQQLKMLVAELQEQVNGLKNATNNPLKGSLDDLQIERVINADISGTSTTNGLLREVTVTVSVPYSLELSGDPETLTGTLTGTGTITVLDYPDRIKINTWKGQRLAEPVYDASEIIYP